MPKAISTALPLVRQLESMDLAIRPLPGNSSSTANLDQQKSFLFAAMLRDFSRLRHLVEVEGLHPDTTVEGKPTALCYAALKQDNCLLSYLIKRGANPNRADRIGMTPLHYAALGGSSYCIADLVRHGALLNQRNQSGDTPLQVIRHRADLAECAELLRRYGAIDQRQSNMVSGFH